MDTVTFTACKHLSFDRTKFVPEVKMNLILHKGEKVVWNRTSPDGRQLCQFCNLRGRINSATGCLTENDKHCNDYADEKHVVSMADVDTD